MLESYTDWIAMFTAIIFVILIFIACILVIIWDTTKTIEQNKYIQSLNEHDKSIIATYKAINGRLKKHDRKN